MTTHTGYLLIADISGYTAYLTSTEQDHASGVVAGLLEALVSHLVDPIRLWRLEGDAVLAYTTDPDFPDGHTFLTICDELYCAFLSRRMDIHANSTCDCRACAAVPTLDLKIIVHHGSFEEFKIGPMSDISGSDAIIVHRMAKTGVKEATGIQSYCLISDTAFEAMGSPQSLVPYAEEIEHFGELRMHAYDLAEAWQRFRDARKRVRITRQEALWIVPLELPITPTQAWEFITAPGVRKMWQDMIAVNLDGEGGRPAPGTRYHCVHKLGEFWAELVDWEPFEYFTVSYGNAFHPHLKHHETYTIRPLDGAGIELCYTMGPMFNPDDPDAGPFPDEDAQYQAFYDELMSPWFRELERQVTTDLAGYAHTRRS